MFPQYGPHNNCFSRFSTGGSDSSVSDGLPMHLIYAPEGLKLVSIYLGDVVQLRFVVLLLPPIAKTQTFIAFRTYTYSTCVAYKACEKAVHMSYGFARDWLTKRCHFSLANYILSNSANLCVTRVALHC